MNKIRCLSFIIISAAFASGALCQDKALSQEEFDKIEVKSQDLLRSTSYRVTTSLEYFETKTVPGKITRSTLREVQMPDKWRSIDERTNEKGTSKTERIWDGKALYVSIDNGAWKKYDGGDGGEGKFESGWFTATYSFLGPTDVNGVSLMVYYVERHRHANKASRYSTVQVHYIRKSKYWFAKDGKIVRKVEEHEIEGRKDSSRETTQYEYEPHIQIKAPI